MKRAMYFVLFTLIAILGLGGCGQTPVVQSHSVKPSVIVESFNPTLDVYAPLWQAEVARRFDNAVVILVHGGDFETGRWIVGASIQPWEHIMTAQDLVHYVQAQYPDRTVVLLACNPGHLKLGIPGVWYAESSVWCVPDRAVTLASVTPFMAQQKMMFGQRAAAVKKDMSMFGNRWDDSPDDVGNVFEFVKE